MSTILNLTSASVLDLTDDSGRSTEELTADGYRMRLLTTTEALSLLRADRLRLIDELGNALFRVEYGLREIDRLKDELKDAYAKKRTIDDFRPHP